MDVIEAPGPSTEEAARRSPAELALAVTGAVPLPVFLVLHLAHEAWLSGARDVGEVLRPGAGALALGSSLLLVWVPLGVHALLGAWFALRGHARATPPAPSLLLKLSGLGALPFLAWHTATFLPAELGGPAASADAGFRLLEQVTAMPAGIAWNAFFYLFGLLATTLHAALGMERVLLGSGALRSLRARGVLPGVRRRRPAVLSARGRSAGAKLGGCVRLVKA